MIALSVLAFAAFATAAELPKELPSCSKATNLDDCLKSALEKGIKALKSGLPSLQVPPIDPLKVEKMTIGAGNSAVNLDQNYKDVNVVGFSDLSVLKAHYDTSKNLLTFSTKFPLLVLKAKYKIRGKVLLLPVFGDGDNELTLKGTVMKHTVQFEEVNKAGQIHLKPKSYKMEMSSEHAAYRFENLFDGNKQLGDQINKVINDSWDVIYNDVKEGYENAFAAIFQQICGQIFSKVPKNAVLP